MNKFVKTDIPVSAPFIQKFAKKYIDLRKTALTPVRDLINSPLFKASGFDTTELEKIIIKNVVAEDDARAAGGKPAVLNDIYRSDLGELLLVYYFEEKLDESDRFKIPVKNISSRELCNLPGRGLDAIGYRVEGSKIKLLFGEAKVSHSLDSPPSVVHGTNDSIYKTHKKHTVSLAYAIRKLSEFSKLLAPIDAAPIACAIVALEKNLISLYDITLGCALVRDHQCVNDSTDFGKMKSDEKIFSPHIINFALLSFQGKTIAETVDLFYNEVAIQSAA